MFAGLDVLIDGSDRILNHIDTDVLHVKTITHSYPYDWRTKKPIIIRASYQWFINIESIKKEAIVSKLDSFETSLLLYLLSVYVSLT